MYRREANKAGPSQAANPCLAPTKQPDVAYMYPPAVPPWQGHYAALALTHIAARTLTRAQAWRRHVMRAVATFTVPVGLQTGVEYAFC